MSYIEKTLKKYGRVNTGWADKFHSDRVLNPNEMICPVPLNTELLGRDADPNSRLTKAPGCNSALDRVNIENKQRSSLVNSASLDPRGILDGYSCSTNIENNNNLKTCHVPDDTIVNNNYKRREEQWISLGEKVLYYKNLSGCL
jgi:hypothetical protein